MSSFELGTLAAVQLNRHPVWSSQLSCWEVRRVAGSVGLTDARIQGLLPGDGRAEYRDHVVRGLRIRVGVSGVKTFVLRVRFAGKPRNYTLGHYHDERFTLSQARMLAQKMLDDIADGRDPALNLGRDAADDHRLKGLVELYLQREVRGRKRSAAEIERTFNVNILPVLGERYVDFITKADVTNLVEKVTFRTPDERNAGKRDTPRQGRMVHQLLSAFFNWLLPRMDQMQLNPCATAWRPRIAPPRERLLSKAEIRSLWSASTKAGSFGKGVQLLMLTGQRRSEVFGAFWSEFDLDKRLWIIPGTRTKNGKANQVHLSPSSLEVLRTIPRASGVSILFPAKGRSNVPVSGFTKLWASILARVTNGLEEPLEHFTMHDIRRTVATGMQRLGVRLEVTEAVLNHVGGSMAGIVGVYQRHDFRDEKAGALTAWASELHRITQREGPSFRSCRPALAFRLVSYRSEQRIASIDIDRYGTRSNVYGSLTLRDANGSGVPALPSRSVEL
jgi:integrase